MVSVAMGMLYPHLCFPIPFTNPFRLSKMQVLKLKQMLRLDRHKAQSTIPYHTILVRVWKKWLNLQELVHILIRYCLVKLVTILGIYPFW